jgi:hypothetical protein
MLDAVQLKAINLTRDYADGKVPLFRAYAAWQDYYINPLSLQPSPYGRPWVKTHNISEVFDEQEAYQAAYAAHLFDYCRTGKRPDGSFKRLHNHIATQLALASRARSKA